MWVLVKVEHGDADKVTIEFYPTFDATMKRVKDFKAMLLDTDDIAEQNEIYDCDCGECHDSLPGVYWWNVTFNSGSLVTIDVSECKL